MSKPMTDLVVPESGWREAQLVRARRQDMGPEEFEALKQFFSIQNTMNSQLLDERLETLRGSVDAVVELAQYRKLLGLPVMVFLNGKPGKLGSQNIYFEV